MRNLLVIGMLVGTVTLAGAADDQVFALAAAGEVDAALVADVRAQLEQMSGAAVRVAEPIALTAEMAMDEIGRAAVKTMQPTDFGIIVIAAAGADAPQGVCLPDEHFGVINVTKLAADATPEQTVRRVMQNALRVESMLVGMSVCPFPLCALTSYETAEDLDHMSGNFCPPCQDRFTRLAGELGLRLVKAEPAAEPAPAAE